MNGTADPLVPYEGGTVGIQRQLARFRVQEEEADRGYCSSTETAIQLWLDNNGISRDAATPRLLADPDTEDRSQVELTLWKGGRGDTAVALYRVIGGGHTVPGGSQYLPERLIGKTNRDIDGWEVVWQFLSEHGRK